MHFEEPITVEDGQGEDRLKPGTDNTGYLSIVDAPQLPIYGQEEKGKSIARIGVHTEGIEDPVQIAAFSHVNEPLKKAREALMAMKMDLLVVSGFLSPANQLARWRGLYERYDRSTPWNEVLAGRRADSTGSVASVIEDERLTEELAKLTENTQILRHLQKESGSGDVAALVKELVQYRANAEQLDVGIDPSTATSVHNLGHSVNVVLTADGIPQCMGVGVDNVSPAQSVTFFEGENLDHYKQLVEADPLLAEYLAAHRVTEVNDATMHIVKLNRRALFSAMRGAGFDFYKGEQGHFTLPRAGGNHPSRDYVYGEAQKFGYKII